MSWYQDSSETFFLNNLPLKMSIRLAVCIIIQGRIRFSTSQGIYSSFLWTSILHFSDKTDKFYFCLPTHPIVCWIFCHSSVLFAVGYPALCKLILLRFTAWGCIGIYTLIEHKGNITPSSPLLSFPFTRHLSASLPLLLGKGYQKWGRMNILPPPTPKLAY